MLADEVVERGLGELGLVRLVVAVAAVAHHINEDIGVELLTVLGGQLHGKHHGLGVVAVHVQHRRINNLGQVGAVNRRAGILKIGGETDLVVDHEVDGAAGLVAFQLRHLRHFVANALAGHGGVAVNEDGQHLIVVAAVAVVELGPHEAFHHRVHGFEVGGVGRQLQVHGVAGGVHLAAVAHVVLHVAVAHGQVGYGRALELRENLLVGLAHDVGQHVEPAAVGHANHHFLHAQLGPLTDDGVEGRNGGFAAFQREALLPQEFGVQEVLEHYGLVEFAQDALLVLLARVEIERIMLHFLPEPVQHLRVADVHVLEADAAGVNLLQGRHNLAQRSLRAQPNNLAVAEFGIEVGFC